MQQMVGRGVFESGKFGPMNGTEPTPFGRGSVREREWWWISFLNRERGWLWIRFVNGAAGMVVD